VQRLFLVVDLERRQDRVRCNEIGERHETDLESRAAALAAERYRLSWNCTLTVLGHDRSWGMIVSEKIASRFRLMLRQGGGP
jgi:hypothetical protein